LVALGRAGEAIAVLTEAIVRFEEKKLFILLSNALSDSGDKQRALEVLEAAVLKWPQDSGISAMLAATYSMVDNQEAVVRLLSGRPADRMSARETEILLQSYIALKRWEDAERLARVAIEREGIGELPFLTLANLLQLRGEDPEVIRIFEPSQGRFSASAPYLFTLALSYYNMGSYERGRVTLERVIALSPTFPQALFLMGHCYSSMGQPGKALPFYQEAVKLRPDSSLYHLHLGMAILSQGDSPLAQNHLESAVALDNSNPAALYELAKFYFQSSRLLQARDLLESAVKLAPDFESPYYLLSQVYARQGLAAEAREMTKRFQEVQAQIRETMRKMKQQDFPGGNP
jgi:tetratricopeptide (TPR) repeat protein